MNTSDFDYVLPSNLIAYYPLDNKGECKLEILSRSFNTIQHKHFKDVIEYLNPGDVLVLNNTRVIPARLYGTSRNRDEIEVLLLEQVDPLSWVCLMKNPKNGLIIFFNRDIKAEVQKYRSGKIVITFNKEIEKYIYEFGHMPLPPYIERKPEESDKYNYQTVYAEHNGSVAAPTAGLHFTQELLYKIREKGVLIEHLTLHVGYGTFKPVKSENVEQHTMHSEHFEISKETSQTINRAKLNGKRIISVGTTSLRAIESCINDQGLVEEKRGKTNLFIYPGYKFKAVDSLITNFHMPRSTLFMLVCAFAGRQFTLSAYEEAKSNNYRFLSYGDAMLII